jgi:ribosomal protein L7/L12
MGVDRELLEIKQRLALIETRLQQLFEHLDIAPRESAGGGWWGGGEEGEALDPAADPEIQDLLAKGNQVQAVKRYRELSGAGLVEAQRAIEQAQQGG